MDVTGRGHGPGTRLGGLSVKDGIVLVGPTAWSVATPREDGAIVTRTGPLGRHWSLRVPIMRGPAALVRQAVGSRRALAAVRGRPPRAAWAVLALLGPFIYAGLGVAIGARVAMQWRPADFWSALAAALVLPIAYLALLMALVRRQPLGRRIYGFHAAEHRVVHAVSHAGAAWRTAARTAPKELTNCGHAMLHTFLYVPMCIMVYVGTLDRGFALDPTTRWTVGIAAPLLLMELRILAPAVWDVLALPGLLLQLVSTVEPEEVHVRTAEAAGAALLGEALPEPTGTTTTSRAGRPPLEVQSA